MSQGRSSRLFSPRRKRRTGCLTVALLLLAVIALVLSLNGLSNRYVRLETRGITVLNLPKELEGYTILHLSDLNAAGLGSAQDNLRAALDKEAYQAVVLSGDMVGRSGRVEPLLEALALLRPNTPVFLVAGDSDPMALLQGAHGDGEVKAAWVRRAEEQGAIFLEAPYRVEYEGKAVWFCPGETFLLDLPNAIFALKELINGLEASADPYEPETAARLRFAKHRLEVMETSLGSLSLMKPGDAIVAVTHHPPDDEQLGELAHQAKEGDLPSPSLFLAGQYNNGQLRLPGLGPVYIPRQSDGRGGFFPGDEGFTGLSIRQGYPVYISPGLGASAYYPLPLRLFNRPVATLVQLTARMTR